MDDGRSSIDARRDGGLGEGPYGRWLVSERRGRPCRCTKVGEAQRVVARASAKNWGLPKLTKISRPQRQDVNTTPQPLTSRRPAPSFFHIQQGPQLYLFAFVHVHVHVPVRDIQPRWRCVSGACRNTAPNSPSFRTWQYLKLLG